MRARRLSVSVDTLKTRLGLLHRPDFTSIRIRPRSSVVAEITASVGKPSPFTGLAVQRLEFAGAMRYVSAFRSIAVLGAGITGLGGPNNPGYVSIRVLGGAPALPHSHTLGYHTLTSTFTERPVPRVRRVVHNDCRWTEISDD